MQKFFTKTLILLLLVSGSGVPVPLHYCMMMDQNSISGCEICDDTELQEEASSDCCADNEKAETSIVSPVTGECCQTELIGGKVEVLSVPVKLIEPEISVLSFDIDFNSSPILHAALSTIAPFYISPPRDAAHTTITILRI